MEKKKILIIACLLFFCSFAFAEITNLKVPATVRLGEKLTIYGKYIVSGQLCNFTIFDLNNNAVERLSDEYTFSDGSFYSERIMAEPPYFRGDDYNAVVVCSNSVNSAIFRVEQPLTIAHPIQKTWEYFFSEPNLDALMLLGTFIALASIGIVAIMIVIKKARES